ncbi:MAG TPA: argininosuccinate lyase [Burkholderiales bacterium]|nr:argininosuccinate lyase [Burkholderiales bacterium]
MPSKPQPWSGRFREPVDERVKRFSASVDFDRRLARQDIAASLAHARMLAHAGIIKKADLTAIERGLARIRREIDKGEFSWSLDAEDVHLNIERRLTALVGEAGKRLHTARSRNDQVATDLRLWLREEIDATDKLVVGLMRTLIAQAERHAALVMPGFTHLQVAQPVTFGHHLLAYVAMLERDRERLAQCRARVNQLPLGAAALAGTSFPIDRARVAKELQFEGVSENSLDAVADRDFAIEFCACAAIAMMHLSRFAEELVLWSNPRFGFVRLPERYSTGSSIMPQKKNPDVPELVRGKTGRVYGSLVALLTLMKAQPLAYNKDNQEDKEPLFDAVDTLKDCVAIFTGLIQGLAPVARAMRAALAEGHATATDLADYLVRKGVAFRDAHEAVARAVREAERRGTDLARLPLATLKRFSAQIGADVRRVLAPEGSVAARNHVGGTAPAQVRRAAARARKRLGSG